MKIKIEKILVNKNKVKNIKRDVKNGKSNRIARYL